MEGLSFDLEKEITHIGRSVTNDFQIKDPSISRRHARIIRKGTKFFIKDLKSQNGTWINGNLIKAGREIELGPGVPVAVGNSVISLGEKFTGDLLSTQFFINLSERISEDNENFIYQDGHITNHEKLELIYEVSTILMQSLDINEIFEKILDVLFYSIDKIDGGAILLIDDEEDAFADSLKEIATRVKDRPRSAGMPYSRTIVSRVIKEGKAVMLSHADRMDLGDLSDSIAEIGIKSIICVPLISKTRIRGAIYVHSISLDRGFQKEDLFLLIGLSSPAALAIENALLYFKRKEAEDALREAHAQLESRVRERTRELALANDELRKRSRALDMRVRQISCLYAVSSLLARPDPLDLIMPKIAGLIPRAWQYPEITCSRIRMADREYLSDNFRETDWCQQQEIMNARKPFGSLEVFYLEERPPYDEGPFLKEERTLLKVIAERVAETYERKRAEEALVRAREQEVEIGAKIQKALLFGTPPDDLPDLQVAVLSIPSQRIDGDFYDFIRHSDECLDLILGDVMGKGVPAALLGAGTKSHFMRSINRLFVLSNRLPQPEEIVQQVHQRIAKELINLESFITLCYARFDLDSKSVALIDCGHTKTIHYKQSTGKCGILVGHNVPLGFYEKEVYKKVNAVFEPGDIFLFYSDGVTEARNPRGEFFGLDRLIEKVETNKNLRPYQLVKKIREAVIDFSQAGTFTDDLTCVAVKMINPQTEGLLLDEEMTIRSDLSELEKARDFLRNTLRLLPQLPLREEAVWQIELALTEAVSNIIKHAYRLKPGNNIRIQLKAYLDHILINLYHWGAMFEPPDFITEPGPDESREGGFGLYILHRTMDDVSYLRREDGTNLIRLIRQIGDPV